MNGSAINVSARSRARRVRLRELIYDMTINGKSVHETPDH